MSERIDGPLLRPRDTIGPLLQEAPTRQKCPDCGRPLKVAAAEPFLGLQTLMVWHLRCTNDHEFEYDTGWDHTNDAYPDEHDRQTARDLHEADVARRTP